MPRVLTVFGRALNVPWTRDDTCKFTFQELCNEVQFQLNRECAENVHNYRLVPWACRLSDSGINLSDRRIDRCSNPGALRKESSATVYFPHRCPLRSPLQDRLSCRDRTREPVLP